MSEKPQYRISITGHPLPKWLNGRGEPTPLECTAAWYTKQEATRRAHDFNAANYCPGQAVVEPAQMTLDDAREPEKAPRSRTKHVTRVIAGLLVVCTMLMGASECAPGKGAKGSPQRYAYNQMDDHGWGRGEFRCLKELWTLESNWDPEADNPGSSAYGIPQGLIELHDMPRGYYDHKTGSGAGAQGHGGRFDVQIDWGLDYVEGRYGDPCSALSFHHAHNWY